MVIITIIIYYCKPFILLPSSSFPETHNIHYVMGF